LSSKTPSIIQPQYSSKHHFTVCIAPQHYLCSQINTITNDPSKVTCRNFSFGTRFTNELKRVPQLCYSNEIKKNIYISSKAHWIG
jgi:hypothetical protein